MEEEMKRLLLVISLALTGWSGTVLGARPALAATLCVGHVAGCVPTIQAAVDLASPGDTIVVEPGVYAEPGVPCPENATLTCAVAISKDDIQLIGLTGGGPVVLQSVATEDVGIAVARTGNPGCLSNGSERIHGSLISGITVTGFPADGVVLFCVDDWQVSQVTAVDDATYGIFPSHSGPGRIDHSFASGANDTGIYVGESHDVRIDHNTSVGNVSGFEIENSARVRADHNAAAGNTAGILSFTLPFLDLKTNADNQIDHNSVHDNNKPNTCPPGDDVCTLPVGTGILLVAAQANQVENNMVTGNNSLGIGVANFCVSARLSPDVCAALDIDPNPTGNQVLFNTVTGNAVSPDPAIAPLPGADLLWDGTGIGNCWANNIVGTTFPTSLPTC
jgi:parallel beta-helix repeat protein